MTDGYFVINDEYVAKYVCRLVSLCRSLKSGKFVIVKEVAIDHLSDTEKEVRIPWHSYQNLNFSL